MRMLTASALLWISGAVIGAALAPARRFDDGRPLRYRRLLGGILGAILVGGIGDKMLERRDLAHNTITN